MKIGILQTGHAPDSLRPQTGDYADLFKTLLHGHGFGFEVFDVVDLQFPDAVTDCDGWLLTGSRHGAYEDLPFIAPLEDFIRQAYAAAVPMAGICFGHQIIAQALGGKVEKFSGGWSVGATDYQLNGAPVTLNAWHQDQVVSLPADARVIGSSDFCQYAALSYGHKALSVQPHPEFDSAFIDGLIKTRGRGVVPDALLDAADTRLSDGNNNTNLAQMIANFFHNAQEARHG